MRGMRGSTSASPITEISSAGASASSPASRSRGPPTPKAVSPGRSACISAQRPGGVEIRAGLAGHDEDLIGQTARV